jgi:M6 family metalloprotease-like protein
MRSRIKFLALTVSFTLLISGTALAAGAKAGGACTKLGSTSTNAGKKYTCIKSGTKLMWNKGVVITAMPKPSASPSATPKVEPVPTAPTIKVSNLSEYRPIKECELTNAGQNNDVNQSHSPRVTLPVDTKKPIRVLIFNVDFPDLVSANQSTPDFKELISKMDSFYTSQSNNQIKFTWTVSPKYYRMSKTIDSYGVGSRAAGSVWQLNNDIQDLAFQNYKREDVDVIIGAAPPSTKREQIASSPAFPTRDLKYKPATYLGGDYWDIKDAWTIPAHEFGHFALGLADLYDQKASMLGQAGFQDQFQHMGDYDLMNWAGGPGFEFTAWNRWIGKLITDDQILCLPNTTTITLLKPVEDTSNPLKGAVIPISNSIALVLENRADIGFDANLAFGAQGIIVYEVNTSIDTGNGPMRLIRKKGSSNILFRDNALQNGDSLTYRGYTIKIVGESGKNKYVEVSKQG